MSKIHITLVGGQAAPVYNGIVATQPDKVIFIYSKQSAIVVDQIKNAINIPIEQQEPLDETDPIAIMERANSLAKIYKNDEVVINISSGLKSWSHLFGCVFQQLENASVVYMDQNNVLWNYKTMQHSSDFVFDMDVLFRLQQNELKHYVSFDEYTDDDCETMNLLISARRYNCGNFNKLTTILSKEHANMVANQRNGVISLSATDYIEWEKPNFVRLCLSTRRYGVEEFEMDSPHAVSMAFSTGWFEYKIARMLSHWRHTKDIRLNCIFPPKGSNSVRFPKNEVDIIVNTGTKILFVECKTNITSSNDIDKFRTVVKNYGGMGSKALFITDNEMTPLQKEKCNESGIISFSLQDKSYGPNKEQELFKLLESELFNINTK